MRQLTIAHESWPVAGHFTIARGTRTAADVVVVALAEGSALGRGECVPYPRHGETVAGVMAELEAARTRIERGLARQDVPRLISLRAARNVLDCALWDLEAKKAAKPVWRLAGLDPPRPCVTAYTLSLDTPEAMATAAAGAAHRPLLKLKLGRNGDADRLKAVRRAAPRSRLIVDANEGWTAAALPALLQACAEARVELVEQPLPADQDEILRGLARPLAICADESALGLDSLSTLIGKYDAINIKLDKTGGLTEALALALAARASGLKIMVGCMLATSLAMAPAMLVAQYADYVDLDGPLLLARDRHPGIAYDGSLMTPPPPALWG
ncbi:MAG: N-acetyl-D-Glu racemase DgcA [Hyphomicrobiales bacterium]